jgi:PAS domain S-box-containing protein
MKAPSPPERRTLGWLQHWVHLVLLAVFVVIVVVRGLTLWWRHADSLEDGREHAEALAHILSEHLAGTIAGLDAALVQLSVHSTQVGGPRAPASAWDPVLRATLAALPGVGSISVLDDGGIITHSTLASIVGQSRGDRFLFQRLLRDPNSDLVADTPMRSLASGKSFLPLGRRLRSADGAFAGSIVVTFEPERLRAFYRSVDVGKSGIIWVLHPAGSILFEEPSAGNPMGKEAAGSPILAAYAAHPGGGYVRGPIGSSRESYETAYRTVGKPPLIMAVSLADSDVLADWWREVWIATIVNVLIAIVLLIGAVRLQREIKKRARSDAALVEKVDDLQQAIGERDEAYAALSAGQARFQAIMDHAPLVVFLQDLEGRYVFVNRAFETYAGVKVLDALGKRRSEIMPAAEAAQHDAYDREVVERREPIQREITVTLPAGKRTALTVRFPIFDRGGTLTSVGIVAIDISERRNMEAQLVQAQKMEAIGQLTGGIAHDFNNLLTAILINADILLQQLESDENLRPLAQVTLEAAERGAALTSRLLAFSRRQMLEARTVDINGLLHGMEQLLRRSLGEHVAVVLRLADNAPAARVDPHQLETAVLNLAVNARDAMAGGGTLTIETASVTLDEHYARENVEVKPGDYVMIAVSDTGAGMEPDVAARAFEPFFTTKGVGKGTGLGLSMVYGFVKQSEGHVKIYSERGVGTALKLYLPRAETPVAPIAARAPAGALPTGKEMILLVEDDRLVRINTEAQLLALGYTVVTAENAAEAVDKIVEGLRPDLLFTDVVMPGKINGFELAKMLRGWLPDLKALFMSGYTQGATTLPDGTPVSAAHFLGKPFRRAELAAKIREVLGEPVA